MNLTGPAVVRVVRCAIWLALCCAAGELARAADPPPTNPSHVFIWPDLAPGETSRSVGEPLPPREGEKPPITRVVNVRRPSLAVFSPQEDGNGVGILILPGGGFGRVVPDLEGSEAAARLNQLGITAFVLNYRDRKSVV